MPEWNPLGEFIHPREQVLIKPNLVFHKNGRGLDPLSVITHASVIRAIVDYVIIALQGNGTIVIGDAPLQKADMSQILRISGLEMVLSFYQIALKQFPGIKLRLEDFRLHQARTKGSMIVGREILDGANAGYQVVSLGKQSFLQEISARYEQFRVTDYDSKEMLKHHNPEQHEYLIARTILDSDVVINIPKLKTHRKVGLTAALKNLVGINGYKDWLPHHTNLSKEEGGDEYLHPSRRKQLDTRLDEAVDITAPQWAKYALRAGRLLLRASEHIIPPADAYKEGSWWGNDTLWRTVLDLNRILLYSDRGGVLQTTTQRRYMTIVDAMLAGEGEGPMDPTPRWCGLLLSGFNPVRVDSVCASLAGFDPDKIPLISHGRQDPFLMGGKTDNSIILSNQDRYLSVPSWDRAASLAFAPPSGWLGFIEKP